MPLQALPSEHGVPAGRLPVAWQVPCAVQVPDAWHGLLVAHDAPAVIVGTEQIPVAGSHVLVVWQGVGGAQVTGLPPTQVPAWHVSPFVHALPSSHAVPSGLATDEHFPVAGSQVPAVWH
jgi:hypothetical protein